MRYAQFISVCKPARKSCIAALLFLGFISSGLAKASILGTSSPGVEKYLSELFDYDRQNQSLSVKLSHHSCDFEPSNEPSEIDGADLAFSSPIDLIFSAFIRPLILVGRVYVFENTNHSFAPRGPPRI